MFFLVAMVKMLSPSLLVAQAVAGSYLYDVSVTSWFSYMTGPPLHCVAHTDLYDTHPGLIISQSVQAKIILGEVPCL